MGRIAGVTLFKKITTILTVITLIIGFSFWTSASVFAAEAAGARTGALGGETYFLFPEQDAGPVSLSFAGGDERFQIELQRGFCFAETGGRGRAFCLSRIAALIQNNSGNNKDNIPLKFLI